MQHKTIALKKSITRYIFVAMIMIIAHANAFAQKASFGARVGLNVSSTTFDGISDIGIRSKAGLDIATFMELKIGKRISLVPEIGLVSYGAKLKYDDDDDLKTTFRTSYIQLPVLVKYRFNNGISVVGGPQATFLLKAEEDYDNYDKEDIKKYLKKNDFFLTLGVGYELPAGLGIGLRYNAGLTNIYDVGNGVTLKNHSFGFHLSYRFASRAK